MIGVGVNAVQQGVTYVSGVDSYSFQPAGSFSAASPPAATLTGLLHEANRCLTFQKYSLPSSSCSVIQSGGSARSDDQAASRPSSSSRFGALVRTFVSARVSERKESAIEPEMSRLSSVATPIARPRTWRGKHSEATIIEHGPAPSEKLAMKRHWPTSARLTT